MSSRRGGGAASAAAAATTSPSKSTRSSARGSSASTSSKPLDQFSFDADMADVEVGVEEKKDGRRTRGGAAAAAGASPKKAAAFTPKKATSATASRSTRAAAAERKVAEKEVEEEDAEAEEAAEEEVASKLHTRSSGGGGGGRATRASLNGGSEAAGESSNSGSSSGSQRSGVIGREEADKLLDAAALKQAMGSKEELMKRLKVRGRLIQKAGRTCPHRPFFCFRPALTTPVPIWLFCFFSLPLPSSPPLLCSLSLLPCVPLPFVRNWPWCYPRPLRPSLFPRRCAHWPRHSSIGRSSRAGARR